MSNKSNEGRVSSDHEEVGRVIQNINQAWKQGRTDQLQDFFHPDIIMTGPSFQEMPRGRAACMESYREFTANAKVHHYTESDLKIAVWDDTAVCTYAWSMTYERDGKQSRETGTDQFVLSRQGEKWLAVYRYINFEPSKVG